MSWLYVKNTATNMGVEISLQDTNFSSFGYTSKSEIVGLEGFAEYI